MSHVLAQYGIVASPEAQAVIIRAGRDRVLLHGVLQRGRRAIVVWGQLDHLGATSVALRLDA